MLLWGILVITYVHVNKKELETQVILSMEIFSRL